MRYYLKSVIYIGVHLYVVHFMGLDKHIMKYIHYGSLTWSILVPPKHPLCSLFILPAIPPLETTDLSIFSTILPFSYHIVGIVLYVAFSS